MVLILSFIVGLGITESFAQSNPTYIQFSPSAVKGALYICLAICISLSIRNISTFFNSPQVLGHDVTQTEVMRRPKT